MWKEEVKWLDQVWLGQFPALPCGPAPELLSGFNQQQRASVTCGETEDGGKVTKSKKVNTRWATAFWISCRDLMAEPAAPVRREGQKKKRKQAPRLYAQ